MAHCRLPWRAPGGGSGAISTKMRHTVSGPDLRRFAEFHPNPSSSFGEDASQTDRQTANLIRLPSITMGQIKMLLISMCVSSGATTLCHSVAVTDRPPRLRVTALRPHHADVALNDGFYNVTCNNFRLSLFVDIFLQTLPPFVSFTYRRFLLFPQTFGDFPLTELVPWCRPQLMDQSYVKASWLLIFHFYRAMLCIAHVCLFVTRRYSIEMAKHIKIVHLRVATPFHFSTPNGVAIFRRKPPLTAALNAGGVWKIAILDLQYVALFQKWYKIQLYIL